MEYIIVLYMEVEPVHGYYLISKYNHSLLVHAVHV